MLKYIKITKKDTGSYKGVLAVKIKHRKPLLRVIGPDDSYYLDEYGKKFPISTKYTANVLVATGSISDEFAIKNLLPFVIDIEKHPFWKAQVEQIFVAQNGEVSLIPLVGDHIVELGELTDYREKTN